MCLAVAAEAASNVVVIGATLDTAKHICARAPVEEVRAVAAIQYVVAILSEQAVVPG